jgi:exodeoxyribonuclease-3
MNRNSFSEFMSGAGQNADVICLQETKMRREQAEVPTPGFEQYWYSADKAGYSGTAVFSRVEPINVSYGIGKDVHDREGRVITLEYEGFYLVNVYTPNSRDGLERLPYRMEWEDAFRAYLLDLDAHKPVLICGDLNVAHAEIDLAHPKENRQSAGFTAEERGKLSELLDSGFIDIFRHFYPDTPKAYSWWSYRAGARQRNVGWRIDYFLASKRLAPQLTSAAILANVLGSDHCPVELIIESGE